MATSAVNIASNALVLIGDSPISALNESPVADALYDQSYESILSIHRWRFATKKAQLAQLAEAPQNEYQYQYQLPADLIYLIRVTVEQEYEIYGDKLYSNANTMNIDYIYRVDESELPAYFVKAFEFYLAAQFAIPVTGNSTRAAEYNSMYEMQMKRAKYADSTQRPNDGIQHSPYTEVRF